MEFHLLISNHRHVFRTIIDPLQCDAEYPIDRKILSAMGDSNPGLTGERPVFYYYTNNLSYTCSLPFCD